MKVEIKANDWTCDGCGKKELSRLGDYPNGWKRVAHEEKAASEITVHRTDGDFCASCAAVRLIDPLPII
jgi:hypothetical protein